MALLQRAAVLVMSPGRHMLLMGSGPLRLGAEAIAEHVLAGCVMGPLTPVAVLPHCRGGGGGD